MGGWKLDWRLADALRDQRVDAGFCGRCFRLQALPALDREPDAPHRGRFASRAPTAAAHELADGERRHLPQRPEGYAIRGIVIREGIAGQSLPNPSINAFLTPILHRRFSSERGWPYGR